MIREIAALGHEIGYHYDDLSECKGDYEKAIQRFQKNLAYLRQFGPVTSATMEGAPLSKFDNRDLWGKAMGEAEVKAKAKAEAKVEVEGDSAQLLPDFSVHPQSKPFSSSQPQPQPFPSAQPQTEPEPLFSQPHPQPEPFLSQPEPQPCLTGLLDFTTQHNLSARFTRHTSGGQAQPFSSAQPQPQPFSIRNIISFLIDYLCKTGERFMSNNEIKEFDAIIKAYGKKIANSKKASEKLLIDIGVITEKGNVRKPYKELCTVSDQD
ncbi:MAG: hypothetical protein AB9834_16245 [Lentimicrobium sp.]